MDTLKSNPPACPNYPPGLCPVVALVLVVALDSRRWRDGDLMPR